MEPTFGQYQTTLQSYRNINIQINVLDFEYNVLDNITGLATSVSVNLDSDSDIRRTANVTMQLQSEYTRTTSLGASIQSHDMYWTAGNLYWFDKYIQIYIGIDNIRTGQTDWVNQGIYLLNMPSVSFDATTNELTFEAVDMMAKITGMRNGYLQGVEYSIPSNSIITNVIESLLIEAGFTKYILNTPPVDYVPYDINVDIGSTLYDLLSEIRDINANWEMFFDEDGTFIFQQIPSGNVLDPNTDEETMLAPTVQASLIKRLELNYSLETDFEEVKNYIEVVGKMHEPYAMIPAENISLGASTSTGSSLNIDISGLLSELPESEEEMIYTFGFPLNVVETEPNEPISDVVVRSSPIYSLRITYSSSGSSLPVSLDPSMYLKYDNQYYVLRVTIQPNIAQPTIEYAGYMQAYGVSWEDNPESPFYVGYVNSYTTKLYDTEVTFVKYINAMGTVMAETEQGGLIIDISGYIDANTYNSAPEGTIFQIEVETPSNAPLLHFPVDRIQVIYNNTETGRINIEEINTEKQISLDFAGLTYLLEITKLSSGDMIQMGYIRIGAEYFGNSTDSLTPPTFSNQIRYVCVGDEYDNIYTNDLALQRSRYEIYLKARLHDSLSLEIVPIYWLGVNEIISYYLPNEVDEEGEPIESYWLTKSIDTTLSVDGTQSIQAIRYYPLYPSV